MLDLLLDINNLEFSNNGCADIAAHSFERFSFLATILLIESAQKQKCFSFMKSFTAGGRGEYAIYTAWN